MGSELDRDEFIAEKWNSLDTLSHARQLLHDFTHLINKSRPAAMMIRHSIRHEIKSATEIKSANLTPLGHAIARYFGQIIPNGYQIQLYSSISPRCKETAHNIVDGYTSVLNPTDSISKAKLISSKLHLQTISSNRPKLYELIANVTQIHSDEMNAGAAIVQNWIAGNYPPSLISPLNNYVELVCQHELSDLQKLKNQPNTLIINISHDLPLMGLRARLTRDVTCTDWLSFLGGFILQDNGDQFFIIDRGKKFVIHKWWN